VVDTTAPTGTAVPQEIYCGRLPEASDTVTDVYDLAPVTIEYVTEPDVSQGGEYTFQVSLTDTSGNQTVIDVPFTVIDDHTAPLIYGAHDLEGFVGMNQSYLDGITVTDNYDPNPVLVVDNSQVNLHVVGDYPVTYTASDDVGNQSSVTITLHVVIIDNAETTSAETQAYVDEAYAMAEEILDDILWYEDTEVEKAMKIFYWVHNNIRFVLRTPQYDNWAVAAINTFSKKYSSCYGTWAVCKAMLDVEGIENLCVVRKVSRAHPNYHYWALVKLNGEWYHCDAQKYFDGTSKKYFTFMMTDKEIYAAPSDHTFDKSKYPERSTKSVQKYVDVYNGKIKSGFPYK
jgi:hypothetical protein